MLDVVFAVFGLIGSNVFIAFLQNSVRTMFALTSAQLHRADYPVFFLCLVCFTIVEISRYGSSFFNSIGMKDFFLSKMLLKVRWNAFLLCYPIGATLESVMHWEAVPVLQATTPMLYSLTMPNKYNFAFNFSYFLIFLPFAMAYQVPQNYQYLLVKRKQYYDSLKTASAKKTH